MKNIKKADKRKKTVAEEKCHVACTRDNCSRHSSGWHRPF